MSIVHWSVILVIQVIKAITADPTGLVPCFYESAHNCGSPVPHCKNKKICTQQECSGCLILQKPQSTWLIHENCNRPTRQVASLCTCRCRPHDVRHRKN